jgi:prophage regulatory protein
MSTHPLAPAIDRALAPILSPKRLAEITGLAPATLWRMRRRGELPEPIRLSPGRVGWLESTVVAWLQSRETRETSPAARGAQR